MYPQAISHGNVLSFIPPGFKHTINVKFPDQRLAVCEKCKRNYKTRDMCRVRNQHTAVPWSTAYICITLDDSCTGPDGRYIDTPLTVRMVQWQPFCVREPFDPKAKVPVCAACKKANRTRQFCRDKHAHRQLPWCSVYVMLSAVDKTDPNTVVAEPSQPLAGADSEEKKVDHGGSGAADTTPAPRGANHHPPTSADGTAPPPLGGRIVSPGSMDRAHNPPTAKTCDDINAIPESRTFLCMVSCKEASIKWLQLSDEPDSPAAVAAAAAAAAATGPAAAGHAASAGGLGGGPAALLPQPGDPTLMAAHYAAGMSGLGHPAAAVSPQYFSQLVGMGYTPQQAFTMQQQYYQQGRWWGVAQDPAASQPPSLQPPQLAAHVVPELPQPGTALQNVSVNVNVNAAAGGVKAAMDNGAAATAAAAAAAAIMAPVDGGKGGQGGGAAAPVRSGDWQQDFMYHPTDLYHQHQQQHNATQLQMNHAAAQRQAAAHAVEPNSISLVPQEPTAEDLEGVNLNDDEVELGHQTKRQRVQQL